MKVFCDGDCDGDCTSPKLVATGAKCQLVLAVLGVHFFVVYSSGDNK